MFKWAAIVWCLLFFPAAGGTAAPLSAIVFPLDGTPDEALDWLREAVAISLSDQLRTRELNTMDYRERVRLIESLDLPAGIQLSRGSMIRAAQQANADFAVLGSYSGTDQNLKIAIRVLEIKTLKLSGEIAANGSLSSLPQLENELAWLILSHNGLEAGQSREEFHKRVRKIPNTAFAAYVRSLSASSEKEEIELLRKALREFGEFPQAQVRLAGIYFEKRDCASTLRYLPPPGSGTGGEFMRGTCYVQGNQPAQAVEALSEAARKSRASGTLSNLGVAHLRTGDTEQALKHLLEAHGLDPENAVLTANLALVHFLRTDLAAARSLLEKGMESHPKDGMLRFLIGTVMKAQGQTSEAAAAFTKAAALGIKAEKLEQQEPRSWSRIVFVREAESDEKNALPVISGNATP